jgi:hypothetical protein
LEESSNLPTTGAILRIPPVTWMEGPWSKIRQVITSLPQSRMRHTLREFLGATGFCRIWIPGFSAMSRPLYDLLTGPDHSPLKWTDEAEQAFQSIKTVLGQAPALRCLDVEKPFNLFVHEKDKIALGILTQTVGPWQRPVAYLSRKLDSVATSWPPCLRALAATVLLVKEADKVLWDRSSILRSLMQWCLL